MLKQQKGFTLLELVIVILVLGILAVIAIPKFIDLTNDAKITTATNNLAESLTAASNANITLRKNDSTKGVAVSNCTDLAASIPGGLPAGYTITSAAVSPNAKVSCTLTGSNNSTATFTAEGIK